MEFFFPLKDKNKIKDVLLNELGDRPLRKLITFTMTDNILYLYLSKMGTSRITFSLTEEEQGWRAKLVEMKIAVAHRPFKEIVIRKILAIVMRAGGQVVHAS
jgi:hypothetical protein